MDKKEQRRLLADWLFESLISVQSSCLAQESKQRWLLPRHSFIFFAFVPTFLDELARKCLLRWLEKIGQIGVQIYLNMKKI